MKKWGGLFLSVLFIAMLILIPGASDIFRPAKKGGIEKPRIALAQEGEKEGKGDPYSIALLKQVKEKVDAWLKSLNEKIEKEDITRFKVRFYEFLRNMLEWVKEKIDDKIDSSEKEKDGKKEKDGIFRQTRQGTSSIFGAG
ncbi:MAG: hypothetical protein ACE144_07965 [Thermodesulfobacteriota bacterium]